MSNKGVKNAVSHQIQQTDLHHLIDSEPGMNKLILVLLGKYGIREGETVHLRSSWIHIDDEESRNKGVNHIQIPKSGALCSCDKCTLQGYFERRREKYKEKYGHKPNKKWYRRIEKKFYALKAGGHKFKKHRWTPKSDAGFRMIPLFFEEYNPLIKSYFEENNSLGLKRQAIWNRVYRAGKKWLGMENTEVEDAGLYPHALRSTAAQFLVDNGMSTISLCAFMGWQDISVADVYIRPGAKQMEKEFREIVSRTSS